MTQTWLRPNGRVLVGQLVVALAALAAGLLLAGQAESGRWPGPGALLLIGGGGVAAGWSVVQLRRPRIGYRDGQLILNLRLRGPCRVPIEEVECFFLGRATPPVPGGQRVGLRLATVVVRLREAAGGWSAGRVWPMWGTWREGYITIYGSACEPLDLERVNQLNRRLSEVQGTCRAPVC